MQILSLSCYFNISFPSFRTNPATLLLPTVRGMWERGGGGNSVVVFIRTVGTVEMDPLLEYCCILLRYLWYIDVSKAILC